MRRRRNAYAINLNGARNAALAEGRSLARWVLPWDGSTFLTRDGWAAIRAAAADATDARYLIVPMARMVDNRRLLVAGERPVADQEPQIAFCSDAAEGFDPRLRYGRSDKAALLARLGVDGQWAQWPNARAGAALGEASVDAGRWRRAGWVARLASGNETAETVATTRFQSRLAGIVTFLQGLDERAVRRRWDVDQPLFYPGEAIARLGAGGDGADAMLAALQGAASPGSNQSGGGTLVLHQIIVTALAAAATDSRTLAATAADSVRTRFIDPATAMQPHLRAGGDGSAIIELRDLVFVLDAVRIIHALGALDVAEMAALRRWSRALLDWLLASPQGRRALMARDHVGTWYDLLLLAVAAFVDEAGIACDILERAGMRIAQQFRPDGSQPEEEARPRPQHCALFNLEAWTCLARAMRPLGFDAWGFTTPDRRSLRAAVYRLEGQTAGSGIASSGRRRLEAIIRLSSWRPPGGLLKSRPGILLDLDRASGLPPFWEIIEGAFPAVAATTRSVAVA